MVREGEEIMDQRFDALQYNPIMSDISRSGVASKVHNPLYLHTNLGEHCSISIQTLGMQSGGTKVCRIGERITLKVTCNHSYAPRNLP